MDKLTVRKRLSRIRRRLFESIGSDRYSRPALHDLERKLEVHIPYRNGFFIEAGANDGYRQSNTYYYEKFKGWTGILIEGIPDLYRRCRQERRSAHVFNAALVDSEWDSPTATMRFSGLMSLVSGARKEPITDQQHLERGVYLQRDVHRTYQIEVPARTLTDIIDEVRPTEIDLLSLDVEGYELPVLRGLDLQKYKPKFMLIEANYLDELEAYLAGEYEIIDRLTHLDILFRAR